MDYSQALSKHALFLVSCLAHVVSQEEPLHSFTRSKIASVHIRTRYRQRTNLFLSIATPMQEPPSPGTFQRLCPMTGTLGNPNLTRKAAIASATREFVAPCACVSSKLPRLRTTATMALVFIHQTPSPPIHSLLAHFFFLFSAFDQTVQAQRQAFA